MEVVAELLKAAGDSPDVKEAGMNLGKTALTITKTINHCLLPLAALNYGIEKAKAYFAAKFNDDIAAKAAAIPPENIVEPKASVAGPALQGLAFTHEEPNLKEMYLNLLATAMDNRVADDAHPAFVEIIKQLNSQEAQLLQSILKNGPSIAIVEIRATNEVKSEWMSELRHLLNLTDTKSGMPVEVARLPAIVDNWVRLGLIEVYYDRSLAGEKVYDWVENRPEFQRVKMLRETSEWKITFDRGSIIRTALGVQFAKAVGLL